MAFPDFLAERERMVEEQIAARGVRDVRVLAAMRAVPRHRFVSDAWRSHAYEDRPLPIGEGQTISQPYIVALMSALLHLQGDEKVLEIGTGCGYQAAVLAHLAREVHTVEYLPTLADHARRTLQALGYVEVQVHVGDGGEGWPSAAPYDAILVAAAAPRIPTPLREQLALGGRLIAPIGTYDEQWLVTLTRTPDGFRQERHIPVRFVPLRGRYGWPENDQA